MVEYFFFSLTYQVLHKAIRRRQASFGVCLRKDVTTLHINPKSTIRNHYWPNGPHLSIRCKALWKKYKTLPHSRARMGI